ncbi:MAG: phosphotransferase [Dehalococcoidia bacterium]|jgi:hypothetical protein|nr:phosphotransferase [Dehalococcoidia bacterium]
MAQTRPIPEHAGELTAAWLTESLRSAGVISTSAVEGFESRTLGEGEGFLGDLARLSLRYDPPEDGAPATLIAKFPTAQRDNRAAADLFQAYDREIRFYDELADDVPVRKPRLYFSDMDPEPRGAGAVRKLLTLLPARLALRLIDPLSRAGRPRRYVLLLEDMAPARVGDQVAGSSLEDTELALRNLAVIHARFWNDPRIDSIDWIAPVNQDARIAQAMFEQALPSFRKEYAALLPPRAHEIGEWLLSHGIEVMDRLAQPPWTLLHGDYRPDNLFFGDGNPDGDGDGGRGGGNDFSLCVIDWQLVAQGSPLYDVAYFILWSVNPEHHGEIDRLLRMYHATLIEHGVRDYPFERVERDYVLAQLLIQHRGILIVGQLDLSHERGQQLVHATLKRTATNLPMQDLDTVLD